MITAINWKHDKEIKDKASTFPAVTSQSTVTQTERPWWQAEVGLKTHYQSLLIIMVLSTVANRTRTLIQRRSVLLAWRLDREMRRPLILQETGFTR